MLSTEDAQAHATHGRAFRNVAPGTKLDFHDERNVLLGLNGSGKTTLLRLISAALLSDFSEFADEPFAVQFEWRLKEGSLKATVRNDLGPGALHAPVRLPSR